MKIFFIQLYLSTNLLIFDSIFISSNVFFNSKLSSFDKNPDFKTFSTWFLIDLCFVRFMVVLKWICMVLSILLMSSIWELNNYNRNNQIKKLYNLLNFLTTSLETQTELPWELLFDNLSIDLGYKSFYKTKIWWFLVIIRLLW